MTNPSLSLNETFKTLWEHKDPFSEIENISGEIYRKIQDRTTMRFEHDGQFFFIKIHRGVGWKEIFKNLFSFRLPILGAKDEWLAIKKLEDINISTMSAVAYGCRGKNPAKINSFLITEELSDCFSLEDLCANWKISPPSFKTKHALLSKIANISRSIHASGFNHRDYYICHFLIKKAALDFSGKIDENFDLFLIDLHRAQIRDSVPKRWLIKDIGSLYFSAIDIGLTKRDLFRFIKLYTNKPLREVLFSDASFWNNVQKKALWLTEHPDDNLNEANKES